MAVNKKEQRQTIDKLLVLLGVVTIAFLVVFGSLAWYGYNFATDNVKQQLSDQKIVFPPAGSVALPADEFPDLQQYGGQTVDTGAKAKAYADGFIGRHLLKIADGKTYAEVSTAALQNPKDAKLQAQKSTLFQGTTLRALLLNAYAFGIFAEMAKYAAIASFIGAAVMLLLVLLGLNHINRQK